MLSARMLKILIFCTAILPIAMLSACGSRNEPISTSSPGDAGASNNVGTGSRATAVPPQEQQNSITWQAGNNPDLQTFATLLQTTGLASTLTQQTQYTVFAPTNSAFEALPPGVLNRLRQPENRKQLERLLAYHVIPERMTQTSQPSKVNTLIGSPLTLQLEQNQVRVNGQAIAGTSIQAINGVIYPISKVLLPPGFPGS